MRMNPPTGIIWWLSFVLGLLAVLAALKVITVPALAAYTFWMAIAGLALMLAATRFRRL